MAYVDFSKTPQERAYAQRGAAARYADTRRAAQATQAVQQEVEVVTPEDVVSGRADVRELQLQMQREQQGSSSSSSVEGPYGPFHTRVDTPIDYSGIPASVVGAGMPTSGPVSTPYPVPLRPMSPGERAILEVQGRLPEITHPITAADRALAAMRGEVLPEVPEPLTAAEIAILEMQGKYVYSEAAPLTPADMALAHMRGQEIIQTGEYGTGTYDPIGPFGGTPGQQYIVADEPLLTDQILNRLLHSPRRGETGEKFVQNAFSNQGSFENKYGILRDSYSRFAQQGAPLMSFPEFIWEGRLDREFINPYL